jgi:hypothetical protein
MIKPRPDRRFTPFLALVLAMLFVLPGVVPPGVPVTRAQAAGVTIAVATNGAVDAATLESRYRPEIETALGEFQSLFATRLATPLTISFGPSPDRRIQTTWQLVGDLAWIDPGHGQAIVDLDRFLQLSPIEAGNVLRNLIARTTLHDAAHGSLPAGLIDGIASYIERPVLAQQARRGSLVQQLDLAGSLPDLVTIVNASPTPLDPETATALHYAFAAFIVDHYGVGSLQQLVLQAVQATNWQALLTTATGQSTEQLTTAWEQFLPRWFSGGWQSNAVSGFDLGPAQGLFDRGAYTSAISLAEQSQQLFSNLNDQVRLSEVEAFISLSAIGVRAEQLMKDVQTSLDQRDYVQANAKLIEAEAQYAYLPDSHRPASIIATYHSMIAQGLAAMDDLAAANNLAGDWSKTHEARELARSAGNGFAALGDVSKAQAAGQLVHDLNLRLQRITLLAVALVVLVAMWLLVWLWARAPHRFVWNDPRHLAGKAS